MVIESWAGENGDKRGMRTVGAHGRGLMIHHFPAWGESRPENVNETLTSLVRKGSRRRSTGVDKSTFNRAVPSLGAASCRAMDKSRTTG